MISQPSFILQSPFGRPEWRQLRVSELLSARRPVLTRGDDCSIRDYYRFSRSLANAGEDEQGLAVVRSAFPDIWDAHFLYFGDLEGRHEVEARLLTREPFSKTAARFGISETAAAAYESLFFNFMDRLPCKDWLWLAVIRGEVGPALSGN